MGFGTPPAVPVVLEGDYTTWALVIDQTISNTGGYPASYLVIDNDGSLASATSQNKGYVMKSDGTQLLLCKTTPLAAEKKVSMSVLGKYITIVDEDEHEIKVYSGGSLLATIAIDTVNKFTDEDIGVSISPNGQYIAIYGNDKSGIIDRVQVWKGS
jgi:hypothetical protein